MNRTTSTTDATHREPLSAPWRSARLLTVVLVCVTLGIAFAHFGSEVLERETLAFDAAVRTWTLAHRSGALLPAFTAITWLGSKTVLIAALVLVIAFLAKRKARIRPLLLAFAPVAFAGGIALLKGWYGVARPPEGRAEGLSFSFPSGHAAECTVTALVIAYVLVRERVLPRPAIGVAAIIALLVGISRVYLDVHWASDVIGGWLIGLAFAIACGAMYEWARARTARGTSPASIRGS